MISRAVLTRIYRPASQGRTGPFVAACKSHEEGEIEVFMKLSAGCDQQVINLAREAIAACLAGDLGLPVPKPWFIEIPPEIISAIKDSQISGKLQRNCSPPGSGLMSG